MKISDIIKRFFTSPPGIMLSGAGVLGAIAAVIAGVPVIAAVPAGCGFIAAGFIFSMVSGKGAKAVVRESERLDAEKNLKRLEEAAQTSKRIGMLRLADPEIKKLAARLCYEADVYITAAKTSDGAVYDPRTIEGIFTAASAVNVFLKAGNDAAVERHLGGADDADAEGKTEAAETEAQRKARMQAQEKERTLRVLRESLESFKDRNEIQKAGDADAALLDTEELS